MDAYSYIERREKALSEWERGRILKERMLFRRMMNLILDPIGRSVWTSVGDEMNAVLLLVARLFNDFEAAMRLTLMGLGEQAYMPMRDSIETTLLLKLFSVEGKLASRWMKNLNEYRATSVIARLKEHDIDLPLNDMYSMYSQLVHPNIVASMHVVEEIDCAEDQVLQRYHFGGMRNEGFIELQAKSILTLQITSLIMALGDIYVNIHPEFESWWDEVRALPATLRQELGLDIELQEGESLDHIGRKIALKLNIEAFNARLVGHTESDPPPKSGS